MKHRFVKKNIEHDQMIIANNQEFFVAAYEHIRIKHENERKFCDMILTNVLFIFEFMTNVIFKYIFQMKELNFNTQKYRLHKNDVIYDYAKSKFDYYFMKNNTKTSIEFFFENSIENQQIFFEFFFVISEIKNAIVNN